MKIEHREDYPGSYTLPYKTRYVVPESDSEPVSKASWVQPLLRSLRA